MDFPSTKSQTSRRSRTLLAVALIGGAVAVVVMLVGTRPDAQVEPPSEPVYTVAVDTVTPATLSPVLELYGLVTSPHRARLRATTAANVASVAVLAGDNVTSGAVLVELDPAEADIAVAQARADQQQAQAQLELERARQANDRRALKREQELLALAQRGMDRAAKLRTQNLASEAAYDEARQALEHQGLTVELRQLGIEQAQARLLQFQAQLDAADARLRRAQLDLDRTRIAAPFDAAVIQVMVSPGDRVTPGEAVAEVFDRRKLEVRAQIPNRYLTRVRNSSATALKAHIRIDERVVDGRLLRMAASGASGGVDAYFGIDDRTGIEIDRTVQIRLELPPEPDAVALPADALYDLSRIYVVDNGRLRGVTVERLGDYAMGSKPMVLVRSPELRAGTSVALTNLPNAVDGLKIQGIRR